MRGPAVKVGQPILLPPNPLAEDRKTKTETTNKKKRERDTKER